MRTTHTPIRLCPICGHTLDAASSLTNPEAVPKPGDFSVCSGCASLLVFDDRLRPSMPTAAQRRLVEGNADVARTRAAVRYALARFGSPPDRPGRA